MGKSSWTRKQSYVPVPTPREATGLASAAPRKPEMVGGKCHCRVRSLAGTTHSSWAASRAGEVNFVAEGTIKEDPSHSVCGLLSVSSAASD